MIVGTKHLIKARLAGSLFTCGFITLLSADLPAQRLLVVDEVKVSGLADETS